VGGGARVADSEYESRVHPTAARQFRRLHAPLRDRVEEAIESLAANPRPSGAVKLAGRDDYRIRVGDHRVVYAVDDAERLVIVARIAHGREVYRQR